MKEAKFFPNFFTFSPNFSLLKNASILVFGHKKKVATPQISDRHCHLLEAEMSQRTGRPLRGGRPVSYCEKGVSDEDQEEVSDEDQEVRCTRLSCGVIQNHH